MILAIALVCVFIEAVFTALEVAFGAVSRARLRALLDAEHERVAEERREERREERQRENDTPENGRGTFEMAFESPLEMRLQRALRLQERPERLALLFLTVTTLTLWAAASLLTWQWNEDNWPDWTLPFSLIGVLFAAEVLPLLIAARHPEAIVLRGGSLVQLALRVLWPLLSLLHVIGRGVARVFGARPEATPQVTEGELRTALATAEEEGVIESDERAMLEGAMDFRETLVREVMTPRVDIVGVDGDLTLLQVLEVAMREGHSRLPVWEGSPDKIIGIIATKDLIPHLRDPQRAAQMRARDVLRTPYFVPDTQPIIATLEELRRQRSLLAIVVDGDGGTAGLVTIEDLLEELVGEIQDEYDTEEPPLRVAENDGLRAIAADAGVSVRDFERFWTRSFGGTVRLCEPDGDDADDSLSLSAFALRLFQTVPVPGAKIEAGQCASQNGAAPLNLEVVTMNGPRIEEVKLVEVKTEEDETTS
jgi:CBS domain containing-hemolysin-like protein